MKRELHAGWLAMSDVQAEFAQVDGTAGDGMDGAQGETPAEAALAVEAATPWASPMRWLRAKVRRCSSPPGTAGDGGSAAPGGPPESAGALGASGVCWNFATGESCGQ
ncbi:hypothetical protein [Sorangium sp. So ce363]|uniref:hypothetical protein n=1 Tax=Sorangium sp. So ce363 TaxID=3133304 RepID=UPI003F6314F1